MWMRRPLEYWDAIARDHGDTFTMKLPGMRPLIVFSNPDAVREIFADDGDVMHAGRFNRVLAPFLGTKSMLMLDGKEHLRHRRLLMPPFHGERMHAYCEQIAALTREEVAGWRVGDRFPVQVPLQRLALRVIVRTVFGIEEGARFDEFVRVFGDLVEYASQPLLLLPFVQVDLGPASPWGRFRRKLQALDALLLTEIARRRAEGTRGRQDILSLLVDARDDAGTAMTDGELRDELVTLLVAGHETTATALAWALRWILDTPAVESRLRAELDAAVGDDGAIAPQAAAKLEYLDAVVREVVRLQPVIPLVGRILREPRTVGGYDLPAGSSVACSIYLAHRRPELYPEPAAFKPERFLGRRFSPSEFFPFGGGVRRCIGMAFAYHEMKLVLAEILSRVELELVADRPVGLQRRSISIAPAGGAPVVVRRLRSARATA
jgi:cytochrome P450